MEYVTIVNVILLSFMTYVWSSRTWLNSIIKFGFFSTTVMNIVVAFVQFGFIVKV